MWTPSPWQHSSSEPFRSKIIAPPIFPRLSVVREQSSTTWEEMPGRNLLEAAPAAGARMNKGKIVKIAVASVLAMLLLTAAAVSMPRRCDADQLRAFFDRDSFLMLCVVTHLTSICLLTWIAATAPTPAARRSHARASIASAVQLALNLYFVLVARRAEVQDAA